MIELKGIFFSKTRKKSSMKVRKIISEQTTTKVKKTTTINNNDPRILKSKSILECDFFWSSTIINSIIRWWQRKNQSFFFSTTVHLFCLKQTSVNKKSFIFCLFFEISRSEYWLNGWRFSSSVQMMRFWSWKFKNIPIYVLCDRRDWITFVFFFSL